MVSEELPSLVSRPVTLPVATVRDLRAHPNVIAKPVAILLIAVWFGFLAGLGEVTLAAVAKFFLHRYTHLNPHIAWMTPIADAMILAIPGLIFVIVITRWPTTTSLRIAIFVLGFLGSLSVFFRVTWLDNYASVILAIGFAVQASRLVVAHPRGFYSLVRTSLGVMVAIVVVLAVGVYSHQALAERSALTKLPAATAGAPNVLLIVLDTVGAEHLSLYGYSRPTTPQLERFAETGVRFDRAISTAPWTLASHASRFTGRYPHELSVEWHRPLDSTYSTLAEVLSDHGYLTAGFVANLTYCSRESGLDRGFAHYEDFPLSPAPTILSSSLVAKATDIDSLRTASYEELLFSRKTAEKINTDLLSWLSRKNSQRPFFVFLNYFDAHAPYVHPKSFDSMFGKKKPQLNLQIKPTANWSDSEVQAELDAHDASIAYLDQQLGLLFEELQKRGLLENTLIVVTSDHGEEFHEHGVMQHGWSTYLKALHVPLVISFPSHVPSGSSVSEPVTLRDLPATVIDLLNLKNSPQLPGTSLVRYWDKARESVKVVKSPLLSELGLQTRDIPEGYPILRGNGRLESLIRGPYHFIKAQDGREELYDFVSDPSESNDLAQSAEAQGMLQEFRTDLKTTLAPNRSPY
jgi:arylsulfatase A-like enzyme